MYSRRRVISLFSVILVLLSLVTVALAADVTDDSKQVTETQSDIEWATYTDPRFDFTVDYPADWLVIPRDDGDPKALSGLLTFTMPAPHYPTDSSEQTLDSHEAAPQIIIGLYLNELETGQSLEQWTELYETVSTPFEASLVQRQPRRAYRVNQADAVHEEGVSPITAYQFTNLAHEKTVWFIWTNVAGSEDDPFALIYEKVVGSFQFGRNTPTNLREVYGDSFKPLKLEELSPIRNSVDRMTSFQTPFKAPITGRLAVTVPSLDSSWLSPVLNASYGQYYVRCGSDAHTADNQYSQYAADVNTPHWTSIYAAKGGSKNFAGWTNGGYGNLVRIQSGTNEAYYAHLSVISYNVINGTSVSTDQYIGRSGNTSNVVLPYHLHFHVRTANGPVDLTGMTGFNPYANYPTLPGVYENCGRMGR